MSDESSAWLEGFSTAYLVESIHALKAELLRRGLDECGVAMPLLRGTAANRERARVLMEEHIDLIPVPRRAHHDCGCSRTKAYHDVRCPVAETIRNAARHDQQLQDDYVEMLAMRDKVVTIKVRGAVEVES